jgi:hypothetical protein
MIIETTMTDSTDLAGHVFHHFLSLVQNFFRADLHLEHLSRYRMLSLSASVDDLVITPLPSH